MFCDKVKWKYMYMLIKKYFHLKLFVYDYIPIWVHIICIWKYDFIRKSILKTYVS